MIQSAIIERFELLQFIMRTLKGYTGLLPSLIVWDFPRIFADFGSDPFTLQRQGLQRAAEHSDNCRTPDLSLERWVFTIKTALHYVFNITATHTPRMTEGSGLVTKTTPDSTRRRLSPVRNIPE
jgi:hypothetical protein